MDSNCALQDYIELMESMMQLLFSTVSPDTEMTVQQTSLHGDDDASTMILFNPPMSEMLVGEACSQLGLQSCVSI